jgi:sugar lactone lactonase YvrE
VLAQYTTAAPEGGKAGPVTLYLISPGGARYQLARWPDSRTAPGLVAWSPDGKRALFQVFSGKERTEQLTPAAGRKVPSSCRATRRRSDTPRRAA